MIDPPAVMCSAASAVSRSGPLRLTAIVLSNRSEVTSSNDGGTGAMPALFTSTSMRPNSATVASMSAPQSSQSPTWQRTASARRPERADLVGDDLARFELAARDDHVGARLREAQRHRAAQALAAAGDDDDLAGRVEARGASSCRAARSCGRVASDAVDQVPDVDVEQRVDLGRVDAARVAGRSNVLRGPRLATGRPGARSRPRRIRPSPTSATGTPAPRRRRGSRRGASRRRAAATPRRTPRARARG